MVRLVLCPRKGRIPGEKLWQKRVAKLLGCLAGPIMGGRVGAEFIDHPGNFLLNAHRRKRNLEGT